LHSFVAPAGKGRPFVTCFPGLPESIDTDLPPGAVHVVRTCRPVENHRRRTTSMAYTVGVTRVKVWVSAGIVVFAFAASVVHGMTGW
jgi:hypothetical protein